MTATGAHHAPEGDAGSDRPIREVQLPGGADLVVRTGRPDDVAALHALFEELSPTDRYRRFFSAYRPDDAFVEKIVSLPERGGRCLVAEISDASGRHLVGEADFVPLDDGDAELSMVVGARWRGWLAPYLLDVLVEQAADDGFANLRAEVLATNRPMLALLRRRGAVHLDDEDWSTARSTIGTTAIRIPTWPGSHERPRVLVELCAGHWHASDEAREAGFDVITCPGPRPGRPECPVLARRSCPLVDGADVVVVSKRAGDEVADALVEAHRGSATTPVVIDVRSAGAALAGGVDDPTELDRPDADEVVATLRSVLADADEPGGGPR